MKKLNKPNGAFRLTDYECLTLKEFFSFLYLILISKMGILKNKISSYMAVLPCGDTPTNQLAMGKSHLAHQYHLTLGVACATQMEATTWSLCGAMHPKCHTLGA